MMNKIINSIIKEKAQTLDFWIQVKMQENGLSLEDLKHCRIETEQKLGFEEIVYYNTLYFHEMEIGSFTELYKITMK